MVPGANGLRAFGRVSLPFSAAGERQRQAPKAKGDHKERAFLIT
jgi:hypothetical protein